MNQAHPVGKSRWKFGARSAPLALLLGLGWGSAPASAIPAFPGAEGFGANAAGARGGTVYHVTNLNDSGAGSFRDAVSVAKRIIVFDVGGIISLKSDLSIAKDLTIAGQTAPGLGITIYGGINESGRSDYGGGRISFTDSNRSIIRGLRYRHGVYASSRYSDAWGISRINTIIFDHCSVLWGTDETFSLSGDINNVTIQNTIIGQGLESHSAGSLVENPSATAGGGISLLRNLYIDNNTRNPKVQGTNQFVNNVVYNWGASGGDAFIQGDTTADSYVNAEGNYFINGFHTSSSKPAFSRGTPSFHIYAAGNFHDNNKDGSLDGRLLTHADYESETRTVDFRSTPNAFPTVTVRSAQDAYTHIVQNVGAAVPQAGGTMMRDGLDAYLITELTSLGKLGADIAREFEAPDGVNGGFDEPMTKKFIVPNASRPAGYDTDRDGMPDAWERTYGLNPTNAADGNGDFDKTGYTNVEKYLNSIYDGSYPPAAFPAPWRQSDVGAVGLSGTSSFDNGVFTNIGSGADISGTADEFRFIYQPLSGDASITARLTALQATALQAKAGVMIRESLDAGSKYAAMILRPAARGSLALRRTSTGGTTAFTSGSAVGEPYWLRVTRSGNSLIASQSPDGVTWTNINTSTITMGSTVYVGMVVSSVDDTKLNTSTFDNVSVSGNAATSGAPQALISEFRLSGPRGSTDDYVEIYNNSDVLLDLAGYSLVSGAGNGTVIASIPGGKAIPPRGHLLLVGANYSLADYGGAGAAAGDVALSADLPEGSGVSLRDSSNAIVDAAGLASSSMGKGAGLPTPLSGSTSQHAYIRKLEGSGPQDTGDNSSDFYLVEVTNTEGGGGSHGRSGTLRLGAPGPQNLASPLQRNRQIRYNVVDPSNASNNQVRNQTPAGSSAPFGTLSLRRALTNNTGKLITRLRFRIVSITSGRPDSSSTADVRLLSSSGTVVSINGTQVPVNKLSLETNPAQPNGGAIHSSLVADLSGLPGGGLAAGETLNIEFLYGVVAKGLYRVVFNVEVL